MKNLKGHVPAAISYLSPIGKASPTNRLNLAIGLPLSDPKGLEDFLTAVYEPASPSYRHYLTPEQFTKKFGPSGTDYARVAAFAQQNHLQVTATYGNRLVLDVSGSVENIERAFHITLRKYHHPTEARDFYAPDTEPSVDANLPIADISGLNNYTLPHPKIVKSDPARLGANASATTGSGAGGAFFGKDFRAAYLPGVSLTGSGQAVGMLEFDGYYASDISAYETAAGLPAVPLQIVLLDSYDGTPTTGANSGNGEVSLDIEMAICMAPGLSKIVVYEAGPNGMPNDVLSAMVSSNQISQFSSSWGWSGGPSTTTDNLFKQMAAQGQSFFEASGDTDAYTTGANSVNGVDNPSLANAPSSSPYITMVGGTTLTTTGPEGSWVSETVWNWRLQNGRYVGSSGGISSYYSIPSWQTNVSMALSGGSTAFRNIPDVALTADNVFVYYGQGTTGTFGGTSCAAPLWAGLTALMNQQSRQAGRAPVGFINPAIYALANSAAYGSDFHDITTGDNTWNRSPNNFYAVTGYDLCTGWGTPAGQGLINAIAGLPDSLIISPSSGFTEIGTPGGPFIPVSTTFQLTNSATGSLSWSAIVTAPWLELSTSNGILPAGATANVTASLSTATAAALVAGTYNGAVIFSNSNSHIAQTEPFTLEVAPSLVQNGGFETGDFTDWTLVGNTISGSTIYNAVESSANYPLVVHSGNYGAFLGDTQLATLSQTLPTVPGENYLLSFWLDNSTSGTTQQFQVNWGSSGKLHTLYNILNPPAFTWTNLQFIVAASVTNTLLQFGAENDPAYFGLDDVSITHIPALSFQTVSKTAGSLNLTWATASGVLYQVQYKTNLLQPNWINLGAPALASGNTLSISDSTSSPQRFYRLLILP